MGGSGPCCVCPYELAYATRARPVERRQPGRVSSAVAVARVAIGARYGGLQMSMK